MLSPLLAPELSEFVDPKVAGYYDGWPDDGVCGRKLLRLGLAVNERRENLMLWWWLHQKTLQYGKSS